MPVIHVPMEIDNSTLAITSAVTAVITYAFCITHEMKGNIALIIAAVVGIGLYAIDTIPIGLLLSVGIAMIVGIFRQASSRIK